MPANVKIVVDNSDQVIKAMRQLAGRRVYVGIPATNADRANQSVTNAELLYIHEHGAPEANIPARPSLRPGIKEAKARITAGLKKAGQLAMANKITAMDQQLNIVGQIGVDAVKRKISTGPFVPLAERTVQGRLRRTQRGRARLRSMRKKGVDLVAWGISNLKPLIDTAAMRNAITYVVRKGKG